MMRTLNCRNGLLLACLVALTVLAGCGPKNYKHDADDRAYKFIDSQWRPEFGPQANYRITGAPSSPNDLDVEQVAAIERTVSETRLLTIPQAVAIATVHNREYHLQKELLYTKALDMRLVRHAYETQLFGGGAALYASERKKGETKEEVALEPNLGFNRLLATGTLISTRVGARWVDVLTGSGDSGLSAILDASVSQPLLRGSDPRVILEPLTLAEREALYEIRNVARFRKQLVVSVITQCYETIEWQEGVRIYDAYINSLVGLQGRVEKLVAAGKLPIEELGQVKQEILRARDNRILNQAEYDRAIDLLKITLGVRPTMEFDLDAHAFEELQIKGIPFPDFSLDDAVETALLRRLDLATNADMILDAQRAVFVAADGLRTGVNVFGGAALDSKGKRSTQVGAAVDLPLDRVAEQDVYAKALVQLNQRQREYDLTADTIRMEIREAHRRMLETAERYKILSEGLQLAEKRVEQTSGALKYAKLSSRRVLNALEHLRDAENNAADALTDYAIATLNFYRDAEILQVRPDGMWETGPSTTHLAIAKPGADASLTQK